MSDTISSPTPLAGALRPVVTWIFVAATLLLAIPLGLDAGFPSASTSALRHGSTHDGALTAADGVLADGTRVFDPSPGVANLELQLLTALRAAATDADEDGITFVVNSGWRSAEYQNHLLREAVVAHGSEAAAARWVAPPDRSAHVSGDAVDIGPAGAAWLAEHGAAYGLCRTYDNEPWHYELRPEAVSGRCPEGYADPTEDPRLQP